MNLIDTNVLIEDPQMISKIEEPILTILVLEELDRLKRGAKRETAEGARKACFCILDAWAKIKFDLSRSKGLSVDDHLVKLAKRKKYCLVTNDLNMQAKCIAKKVVFSAHKADMVLYSGVKYLVLPFDSNLQNEQVNQILLTKEAPIAMRENEFLIIKNSGEKTILTDGQTDYQVFCVFQQRKGKLELVEPEGISNGFVKYIKPRNAEQKCLMQLLNDPNISILLACGNFGTGKSYLTLGYALQQLNAGKISKIVYVPNNAFNENSREIGALPGDLLEKEIIHMGTLVDIVGSIFAEQLVRNGQVEVAPISTMRGRNFDNAIILVNEAQNLTEDHIKLLVARCGQGTRIFFDGDIKQSDGKVFRKKSGIKLLLNLSKSPVFSKIFGTIRLKEIERSLTAQAAAFLEQL